MKRTNKNRTHVVYHGEAEMLVMALKLLAGLRRGFKVSDADYNLADYILDQVGGVIPLEKRWKCESIKHLPVEVA